MGQNPKTLKNTMYHSAKFSVSVALVALTMTTCNAAATKDRRGNPLNKRIHAQRDLGQFPNEKPSEIGVYSLQSSSPAQYTYESYYYLYEIVDEELGWVSYKKSIRNHKGIIHNKEREVDFTVSEHDGTPIYGETKPGMPHFKDPSTYFDDGKQFKDTLTITEA